MTTYTGPSHEPQFMKEARSIIVGPRARVVAYSAVRYEKQALELDAGTRIANLNAIDFHRRVGAFQVLCTDG